MRLTQDALLRIVQTQVNQRARTDSSLLAVFLCGSILDDEFLLGGTTDIDLYFIHTDMVSVNREIVPLTPEVHLDIAHVFQRDFRQTRSLRVHPWLGPTINRCRILLDPQHFLDFVQASIRGQFERSDYILNRARSFYETARKIWIGLQSGIVPSEQQTGNYLRALYHAANSVASLNGPPLTERRFLIRYPERVAAVQRPGLYPGLLGLLGGINLEQDVVRQWLSHWQAAYEKLSGQTVPVRLHPGRQMYYQKAIETMLESTQPMACLWLILSTWASLSALLPADSGEYQVWEKQMKELGLLGSGFAERILALDAYLDQIDETLDDWAQSSGAEDN